MSRILAVWILALSLGIAAPVFAATVSTMDKDELRAQLGAENLVVLDVRQGRDWSTSEYKIQGAVRVEGGDLSITDGYDKGTRLVLYCA